jgi:hypothetical protein
MSTAETTAGKKGLKLEQPPLATDTNGKITQPQIELEHDAEMLAKARKIDEEDAREEQAKARTLETDKTVKIIGRAKESTELKQFRREEDQALVEWIRTLQGVGAIEIKISRNKPQMFAGKVTKGYLDTISEPITEDELRDRWGGGQYQLKCMRKDERGSWVYFANTMIEVAGDPRLDNLPGQLSSGAAPAAPQTDNSPFANKALDMMERQLHEARKNAAASGFDPTMVQMFMAPLQAQLSQLSKALEAKDDKLTELANKPQNPFQEKLLDKMIEGDTARVTAIRTQFESEIRQLKDNFREDEKRLRDHLERERDRADRDFTRQLDNQKQMYEREIANMKGLQMQLDTAKDTSLAMTKVQLESDIKRLDRDLATAAAAKRDVELEVKELRAKKDQSLTDKLKEVTEIKKLLGVEEGDTEPKSALEKVVDTVMGSEQLFEFAGKWFGPKGEVAPPAGAPQQQLPAARAPRQRPRVIRDRRTQQVLALGADGKYVPIRQNATTGEVEPGVQIPPQQLEFAVKSLEMAFSNKTKADVFARTISTALPPEIFAAIRDLGVDGFLNKVAKLSAASPLRTQAGVNWLRAVGAALLGEAPSSGDAPVDGDLPDLDDAPDE